MEIPVHVGDVKALNVSLHPAAKAFFGKFFRWLWHEIVWVFKFACMVVLLDALRQYSEHKFDPEWWDWILLGVAFNVVKSTAEGWVKRLVKEATEEARTKTEPPV